MSSIDFETSTEQVITRKCLFFGGYTVLTSNFPQIRHFPTNRAEFGRKSPRSGAFWRDWARGLEKLTQSSIAKTNSARTRQLPARSGEFCRDWARSGAWIEKAKQGYSEFQNQVVCQKNLGLTNHKNGLQKMKEGFHDLPMKLKLNYCE